MLFIWIQMEEKVKEVVGSSNEILLKKIKTVNFKCLELNFFLSGITINSIRSIIRKNSGVEFHWNTPIVTLNSIEFINSITPPKSQITSNVILIHNPLSMLNSCFNIYDIESREEKKMQRVKTKTPKAWKLNKQNTQKRKLCGNQTSRCLKLKITF